jgi:hypothetical protein
MKRHVLIFGLVGGLLIVALQYTEYRFVVIEHSVELYGALVAILFAAFGIWLGLRITSRREKIVVREILAPTSDRGAESASPFAPNTAQQQGLGITDRELEILTLIARGLRLQLSSSSRRTPSRPTARAPSTSSEPRAAPRPCCAAKNSACCHNRRPKARFPLCSCKIIQKDDDFRHCHTAT